MSGKIIVIFVNHRLHRSALVLYQFEIHLQVAIVYFRFVLLIDFFDSSDVRVATVSLAPEPLHVFLVAHVLVEVPADLLAGREYQISAESMVTQYFLIILSVRVIQVLLEALAAEESYRASVH